MWNSLVVGTPTEFPLRNPAMRSAIAPTATPIPMDICVIMLKKLVAELISGLAMSANARAPVAVNCIERDNPFTNNTKRMRIFEL